MRKGSRNLHYLPKRLEDIRSTSTVPRRGNGSKRRLRITMVTTGAPTSSRMTSHRRLPRFLE
ncbi:hypothetical protein LB505_007747 [Fusarium chuoi]|nr:hypothetical protein LB505_007747 [Fusarium chuoi]